MNRLYKAFLYSLSGIKCAWNDEPAFRLEFIVAVFMIPAAFFLAPDKVSLILMVGSIFLVFAAELLNTAIEATVNRISTEVHPLAKKAKDTASAAVFFALLNVGLVWGVILFY